MSTPLWRDLPRTVRSRLAAALLRALGWRALLEPPPSGKLVSVVYPHTSNWDFPIGMLWVWATRAPVRFVAKHSLFRPPLGALLRAWGGVSVDRRRTGGNFVQAVAHMIRDSDEIVLVVAPEGTRAYTDHWRSGFYHMAVEAGVPIALTTIDWAHREVGIGGYMTPSGNMQADYEKLRVFYAGRRGHTPKNEAPIQPRQDVPVSGS